MTLEIIATINSDGARRGAAELNRALDGSRGHVERFDRSLFNANRALVAFGGVMAAKALLDVGKAAISAADDFTRLEARLNAIGTGGSSAQEIMAAIGNAADRARVPVNDLTDVYARNAAALERLGYNQTEAVRIAETLSKLGTLSGGSAQSVTAALFQLSQAFNSGTLRGEEFNSIAEQTPEVLRALADSTGQPIGELRKLASEGRITAQTVADAMLYVSQSTDERFGRMGTTVDQSLTLLSNSFAENWGRISKEMGVTESWSDLVKELTKTIEGPVGSGILSAFAFGLSGIADAARAGHTAFRDLIDVMREAGATSAESLRVALGYGPSEGNGIADLAGSASGLLKSGARIGGGGVLTGSQNGQGLRRPTFGPATGDDSEAKRIARIIERTRELSAVEDLRNAVTTARLNGEFEVARQLEKQMELEQRITPEMEKHAPLVAAELRQRIENGFELERQYEEHRRLIDLNRQFADDLASTLTNGFFNAAKAGESFKDTLRGVAADLVEVIAKATLLGPLQNSLSNSFAGSFGSTDFGGFASSLSSGFMFAKGGVLSSPAQFTSGGMKGIAGEAGPEAILPLKRGADGSLGVVAGGSGGGGANVTNVTIHVDGDATDATIAKMERVASQVFAAREPGVVRASVSAVRRENIRDRNYMRR
ncbi:MAG: hypothetical protein C0519_01345 [Hyphomicrobium sp.]|nr:hypothetical protein [Hyphomicrobium sp.]PPD09558.1 MAG: hypothetical protein CTY28_01760 [Hyphomicrobium sp.]